MKKPLPKLLLLTFIVVLALAQVLTGCGKKGQLSGRIYESGTEALIIGKVLVTISGQTITANNGEYLFKEVPAGTQTLKVQAEGYKVFTTSVRINEGQTTKHNVSLAKANPVFAYVAGVNYVAESGYSIYVYAINAASGGFTSITGSPFSTAELNYPQSLVTDADGKFLCVANSYYTMVSVFAIDPTTGYIAPITSSPFATNMGPKKVVMSPGGEFVAVGCRCALNIFSRDQVSGTLSDPQNFTFAAGEELMAVIFDMTGEYLYVSVSAGRIYVYGKNPDNTFAQIAGSPFVTVAGVGPPNLAFGPEGNYLYAITPFPPAIGYHSVNSDGSLGAVTNINLASQTTVCAIAGNTLYINPALYKLESYTINTNGTLSKIGSSVTFPEQVTVLAVDPSERYLYVTTRYADDIWTLAINPDGTLSQPTGDPFETGYVVNSMIIVKPMQ